MRVLAGALLALLIIIGSSAAESPQASPTPPGDGCSIYISIPNPCDPDSAN